MSTPPPEKLLEDISNWATEKNKFIIEPYNNPQTHFSIWIKEPEPQKIMPIAVAYPKRSDNRIMMGWNWRPKYWDIKAYAAIKDRGRKESILIAVKAECIALNLTLGVDPPNIDKLERLAVTRSLPVNALTKDRFRDTMVNLMYMWGFLMSQFEQHNMSRANFDPSDYI